MAITCEAYTALGCVMEHLCINCWVCIPIKHNGWVAHICHGQSYLFSVIKYVTVTSSWLDTYACTCAYIHIYICSHKHTYICTHIYTYAFIHICLHTNISMYIQHMGMSAFIGLFVCVNGHEQIKHTTDLYPHSLKCRSIHNITQDPMSTLLKLMWEATSQAAQHISSNMHTSPELADSKYSIAIHYTHCNPHYIYVSNILDIVNLRRNKLWVTIINQSLWVFIQLNTELI